ncbi:DUF4254 domain-containing protein [Lentzea flaviverrucosa]|uniref:DUF4254 domain-containing protein n=1 Tax=Lentzea flaviverrucosa TaxID=200379 RepID=A0A1H9EXW3_9PSEU|nr:DUF4254 domain-containing protein [Lentzea flaviverrucosa]RDI35364.1 uncharacterized protein DUF4254 [Lentzea flaviverrucosa]SEQ30502.1 Protein of unknown function [Lentzea flaviverrucosa]
MTSMNVPMIALQDDQLGEIDCGDAPSVVLGIPRSTAVTRACVLASNGAHTHPVLAAVAALAGQHQLRAEAHRSACDPFADDRLVAAATRLVNAADAACAVLVDRINMWAAIAITDARTAVVHTETFGQLVSRLVAAWTQWHLLDTATALAGKTQVREALHRVSELSVGYDDLVADLHNGRRRLPRVGFMTGPVVAA